MEITRCIPVSVSGNEDDFNYEQLINSISIFFQRLLRSRRVTSRPLDYATRTITSIRVSKMSLLLVIPRTHLIHPLLQLDCNNIDQSVGIIVE